MHTRVGVLCYKSMHPVPCMRLVGQSCGLCPSLTQTRAPGLPAMHSLAPRTVWHVRPLHCATGEQVVPSAVLVAAPPEEANLKQQWSGGALLPEDVTSYKALYSSAGPYQQPMEPDSNGNGNVTATHSSHRHAALLQPQHTPPQPQHAALPTSNGTSSPAKAAADHSAALNGHVNGHSNGLTLQHVHSDQPVPFALPSPSPPPSSPVQQPPPPSASAAEPAAKPRRTHRRRATSPLSPTAPPHTTAPLMTQPLSTAVPLAQPNASTQLSISSGSAGPAATGAQSPQPTTAPQPPSPEPRAQRPSLLAALEQLEAWVPPQSAPPPQVTQQSGGRARRAWQAPPRQLPQPLHPAKPQLPRPMLQPPHPISPPQLQQPLQAAIPSPGRQGLDRNTLLVIAIRKARSPAVLDRLLQTPVPHLQQSHAVYMLLKLALLATQPARARMQSQEREGGQQQGRELTAANLAPQPGQLPPPQSSSSSEQGPGNPQPPSLTPSPSGALRSSPRSSSRAPSLPPRALQQQWPDALDPMVLKVWQHLAICLECMGPTLPAEQLIRVLRAHGLLQAMMDRSHAAGVSARQQLRQQSAAQEARAQKPMQPIQPTEPQGQQGSNNADRQPGVTVVAASSGQQRQGHRQAAKAVRAVGTVSSMRGFRPATFRSLSDLQASPPLYVLPSWLSAERRAEFMQCMLAQSTGSLATATSSQLIQMLLGVAALHQEANKGGYPLLPLPRRWWLAWCVASQPMLRLLPRGQLLAVTQAVGHFKVSPPGLWRAALMTALKPHLCHLSVRRLTTAAHAVARRPPAAQDIPPGWAEELVSACEDRFEEFDAPAYALVMHALGRLHCKPPVGWLQEVWDSTGSLIHDFSAQELCMLLRGCAYMGVVPGLAWQETLWGFSGPRLRVASPALLVGIGWAVLAALRLRPPREWVMAWLSALFANCGPPRDAPPPPHLFPASAKEGAEEGEVERELPAWAARVPWPRRGRATKPPLPLRHAHAAAVALAALGVPDLEQWCARLGVPTPEKAEAEVVPLGAGLALASGRGVRGAAATLPAGPRARRPLFDQELGGAPGGATQAVNSALPPSAVAAEVGGDRGGTGLEPRNSSSTGSSTAKPGLYSSWAGAGLASDDSQQTVQAAHGAWPGNEGRQVAAVR